MSCQERRPRNQCIKKFQSRVLNRSCADLLFYDKIADYLLQCINTETRPNTLSLFSVLPLIITNFYMGIIINQIKWWHHLLVVIVILLHQIFDIANKKQAYRLSQFNLSTYYIDHLCDSMSCMSIINLIGKLMKFQNQTILILIYFFGMLPFFTHHLNMYTNGYLIFDKISPGVEGILFLQIILIILSIYPQLSQQKVLFFKNSELLLILCSIWLIIFLFSDIKLISNSNKNTNNYDQKLMIDKSPLRNFLVIGILGYIILQCTSLQEKILQQKILFYLLTHILIIVYTFIICQIVLAYAYSQKMKQFSINFLFVILLIAIFYSVIGLNKFKLQDQILISQIIFTIILIIQLLYFCYHHSKNIKYINRFLKDENN